MSAAMTPEPPAAPSTAPRQPRKALLALHLRFILAGALFALLLAALDQGLGLGKGAWISLENLLTYLAAIAFLIDSVLATLLVFTFARQRWHVIAIDSTVPAALLFGMICCFSSHPVEDPHAQLWGDDALAAAPRCVKRLRTGARAIWWQEPQPPDAGLVPKVRAALDATGASLVLAPE